MIQKITPELKNKLNLSSGAGAIEADVATDGPADKAGIERGDVIVSFDGKKIKEMKDLPYIVASTPVGKEVTVEVIRKGRKKGIEVKLGELEGEKESPVVSKAESNLGMAVKEITPELSRNFGLSETGSLVVVEVEDNSPAAEAGIHPGDIILEIDQVQVENVEEFNQKVRAYKAGDTILFLVKRRDATLYLTLKIWE
jgi:serine protease Do